jgi:hypothetical protein
MISEKVFNYFASNELAPLFSVKRIADDPSHEMFPDVEELLNEFDEQTIEKTLADERFRFFHSDLTGPSLEREARITILTRCLNEQVPQRRWRELATQSLMDRPTPYTHPAIRDLNLDSNFLVALNEFKVDGNALIRNGFYFTIVPPAPAAHSSYWFTRVLNDERIFHHARVRLDPFLLGPTTTLKHVAYKMWWYGRELDWNRIGKLTEEEHGRWLPDVLSSRDIQFTDFVWSPRQGEVHFICEELPTVEAVNVRGSRYLHAIYDLSVDTLNHLDGAVRLYKEQDLLNRYDQHVRKVGKIGERVKIFQINSAIPRDLFNGLASTYFVWNQDVIRYFSDEETVGTDKRVSGS